MAEKGFSDVYEADIEKWLSDYFRKPVKLKSCNAEKIGDGQGFTAKIFRLSLQYEGQHDFLPKSAVLKVPSPSAVKETYKKLIRVNGADGDVEEEIRSHIANHDIECKTYEILSAHSPVPLPIVYAVRPFENGTIGAILMEDLSDRASTIGGPTRTLPLDNLYQVADVMADWHAWCLTTDIDWKRYFDPAESDGRKQAYHDKEFETMKKCFQRVNANYPGVFDKMDMVKAKKIFGKGRMFPIINKHHEFVPEVIVHGDLYANNLMFEKKTDQFGNVTVGPKLVAIIDWPMAHRGCGMKDFATLMAFSVDKSVRRQHTADVIQRYHRRLFEKAGSDKPEVSLDELLQIYSEQFVLAVLCFVFMLDWWQKLFAGGDDSKSEKNKQVLFQRCVNVYEDILPLIGNWDV